MSAKKPGKENTKYSRDRRASGTFRIGRDAATGQLTSVETARGRPTTTTVERLPKPGYGDSLAVDRKPMPRHHGAGGVVRFEADKAIMSRGAYERLVDRIEDLEDARDLNAAAKTTKPGDYLPAALMDRIIAGEHPLRVWREHRGLTSRALAEKAQIPVSYLSEIENRKKPGSIEAYRALAEALELTIDDLAP